MRVPAKIRVPEGHTVVTENLGVLRDAQKGIASQSLAKALEYLEAYASQCSPMVAWQLRAVVRDIRDGLHLTDSVRIHVPPYEVVEASREWTWPDAETRAVWASSLEQILDYAAREHGKSQEGYFSPGGGGGRPLYGLAKWLRGTENTTARFGWGGGLDSRDRCSQCGKGFEEPACGPAHALIAAELRRAVEAREVAVTLGLPDPGKVYLGLNVNSFFVPENAIDPRVQLIYSVAGKEPTMTTSEPKHNGALEELVAAKAENERLTFEHAKLLGILGSIRAAVRCAPLKDSFEGPRVELLERDLDNLLQQVEG